MQDGILLVDAALGYGHEGPPPPPFLVLFSVISSASADVLNIAQR